MKQEMGSFTYIGEMTKVEDPTSTKSGLRLRRFEVNGLQFTIFGKEIDNEGFYQTGSLVAVSGKISTYASKGREGGEWVKPQFTVQQIQWISSSQPVAPKERWSEKQRDVQPALTDDDIPF